MFIIFSFVTGLVIGFNVFYLLFGKGVKKPVSVKENRSKCEREGAKLAKATPSEQEDLDFLNQV